MPLLRAERPAVSQRLTPVRRRSHGARVLVRPRPIASLGAMGLLGLVCACGSGRATDPPPPAPTGLARAAFEAKGAPLRPESAPVAAPHFPVIAPETPFGAPPQTSGGAPTPPPSAPAPEGTPL